VRILPVSGLLLDGCPRGVSELTECELLARRRFASQAEARMATFSYIEGWYNPARRHSGIGYLSPIAYETGMAHEIVTT
jgi:transposase InsO family protein